MAETDTQHIDQCALCERRARLLDSHILPAFVFRWVRDTGATPYFRASNAPNRRVQDGLKMRLLCRDCEGLISTYEDAFARNVFYPFLRDSSISVPYEEWLKKFCVSVSWRILVAAMKRATTAPHPNLREHEEQIHLALDVWREFLLGRKATIGRFEQHLLPLAEVAQAGSHWPSRLNRFFLRDISLDVPMGDRNALAYAKLPGFAIFGWIAAPGNVWVGSKVHSCGIIKPQSYNLPVYVADYLSEQASVAWANQISTRQQKKTDDDVRKNLNQWMQSATASALKADLEVFGTGTCQRF